MLLKRILPALILLSLVVYLIARYRGPEIGEVTNIDRNNLEKYWKTKDVTFGENQFHLGAQTSSITSGFRIRNFELSLRMKTTQGAYGILNLSTSKSYDARNFRGYAVVINNSDYSVGLAQKTGSLTKIRNNFIRTAEDNEWFDLSILVNNNNIKVSVNGKMISEYSEPANARRLGDLSGMVLSRSFISLRKISDQGEIVVTDMKIKPLP